MGRAEPQAGNGGGPVIWEDVSEDSGCLHSEIKGERGLPGAHMGIFSTPSPKNVASSKLFEKERGQETAAWFWARRLDLDSQHRVLPPNLCEDARVQTPEQALSIAGGGPKSKPTKQGRE